MMSEAPTFFGSSFLSYVHGVSHSSDMPTARCRHVFSDMMHIFSDFFIVYLRPFFHPVTCDGVRSIRSSLRFSPLGLRSVPPHLNFFKHTNAGPRGRAKSMTFLHRWLILPAWIALYTNIFISDVLRRWLTGIPTVKPSPAKVLSIV